MADMKETAIYSFTGADSMAQFVAWIIAFGAGVFPFPFLAFKWGGVTALAVSLVVFFVVLLGLRSSITVTPTRVTITKKWLFIPYRWYTAGGIDDVWFGADWGMPEGASGIVVKLGRKEIHLGSKRTMHQLYDALSPLTIKTANLKASVVQFGAESEVPKKSGAPSNR